MKIYVMDAFAAKLFGGNQAGVALPEGDVSDETMRLIAAELKHSETAFVRPRADGSVDLRYFTPAGEVEPCACCGRSTSSAAISTPRPSRRPTPSSPGGWACWPTADMWPTPRQATCRFPWMATWCGWTWPRPVGWES